MIGTKEVNKDVKQGKILLYSGMLLLYLLLLTVGLTMLAGILDKYS